MDSVINGTATVQCYVVTLSYVSVCVKMRFFFFFGFCIVVYCAYVKRVFCIRSCVCLYTHPFALFNEFWNEASVVFRPSLCFGLWL